MSTQITIPEKTFEEKVKDGTILITKHAISSNDTLVDIYLKGFDFTWAGTKEEIQARFDLMGPEVAQLLFRTAFETIKLIRLNKPSFVPPPAPYEYDFDPQQNGRLVVGDRIEPTPNQE